MSFNFFVFQKKDVDGVIPQRHIPARFVTLIPREFPASHTHRKKRKSSSGCGASSDVVKRRDLACNKLSSANLPTSSLASDPNTKTNKGAVAESEDMVYSQGDKLINDLLLGMYSDSATSNMLGNMDLDISSLDESSFMSEIGIEPPLKLPPKTKSQTKKAKEGSSGKATHDKVGPNAGREDSAHAPKGKKQK